MTKANNGARLKPGAHLVILHARLVASPLWQRCQTVEERIALSNLHREHCYTFVPITYSGTWTGAALRIGAARAREKARQLPKGVRGIP